MTPGLSSAHHLHLTLTHCLLTGPRFMSLSLTYRTAIYPSLRSRSWMNNFRGDWSWKRRLCNLQKLQQRWVCVLNGKYSLCLKTTVLFGCFITFIWILHYFYHNSENKNMYFLNLYLARAGQSSRKQRKAVANEGWVISGHLHITTFIRNIKNYVPTLFSLSNKYKSFLFGVNVFVALLVQ